MSDCIEAPNRDRRQTTYREVLPQASNVPAATGPRPAGRRRGYTLTIKTRVDETAARAAVRYLLSDTVGRVACPE
jgi:hypothetical protein